MLENVPVPSNEPHLSKHASRANTKNCKKKIKVGIWENILFLLSQISGSGGHTRQEGVFCCSEPVVCDLESFPLHYPFSP